MQQREAEPFNHHERMLVHGSLMTLKQISWGAQFATSFGIDSMQDIPMIDWTDQFRIQVFTRHATFRIHDKAMSIKAAIVRPHETPHDKNPEA